MNFVGQCLVVNGSTAVGETSSKLCQLVSMHANARNLYRSRPIRVIMTHIPSKCWQRNFFERPVLLNHYKAHWFGRGERRRAPLDIEAFIVEALNSFNESTSWGSVLPVFGYEFRRNSFLCHNVGERNCIYLLRGSSTYEGLPRESLADS